MTRSLWNGRFVDGRGGDPVDRATEEPAVLLFPARIWLVLQAGSVVAGEAIRPLTLPRT